MDKRLEGFGARGLLLISALVLAFAGQCSAGEATVGADGLVREVRSSSPQRVFFFGEPVRLEFVLSPDIADGLGDSVDITIRQLRNYRMPGTPKELWSVDLGISQPYETVAREKAALKRSEGAVTLTAEITCKCLGALRIEAQLAGKTETLGDYLHLLPPANIPADRTFFCMNSPGDTEATEGTLELYSRLGLRTVRYEVHMECKDDGSFDWTRLDRIFGLLRKHNLQGLFIIGKDDWKHMSKLPGYGFITYNGSEKPETPPPPRRLDVFARWCGELAVRGRGAVRGCEFFNEPWETGSISGLSSGGAQVRRMVLAGAPALHAVDPPIKTVAGCSGPNDMDSILPYEDVLSALDAVSIHTHNPQGTLDWQAPHRLKKDVWDTESWGSFTDSFGPYKIAHQIHVGMTLVSPLPYLSNKGPWPPWGPWTATFATCQHMLDGMKPAGVAMKGRVPQVPLFEGRGRAVAFVQGFPSPEDGTQMGNLDVAVPYRGLAGDVWQPHDRPNGWFILPAGAKVVARDLYGNSLEPAGGTARLPVGRFGCWVEATDLETLRSAMLAGRLEGVGPVEIAIHDLTARPEAAQTLAVTLTNIYPVEQTIEAKATGDDALVIAAAPQKVTIPAGEERTVQFVVEKLQPRPANRYRVAVEATGPTGAARYAEEINVAVIVKGSPRIDGDLADWAAFRPVPVILEASRQKQSTAVEQYQRLPFAEITAKDAKAYVVEAQAAWDEKNFYIAARINDPTETRRDSNAYGLRGGETYPWPNQHVYLNPRNIQLTGVSGDCLLLGFNTNDDNDPRHWDFLPPGHPLRRIYGWPDTDFEFEVLPVKYDEVRDDYFRSNVTWGMKWRGWPQSEVWRLMDPKMKYWHHAYPLNVPPPSLAGHDQDLVPGGQSVVKREGTVWVYEASIPWSQIWEFQPRAGAKLVFSFLARNDGGRAVEYTYGKSVSVANNLTFHATWERKWSNEAEWGLVE